MASRASPPPESLDSSSRKPSSVDVLQEGHHLRMRADDVGDVKERQPHLGRDVAGADNVSVSAAFFSPSHFCNWSLSHQVASIPAMIACMLRGSPRTRLCSVKAANRKSKSAGPENVWMSRCKVAMDA